MIRSDRIKAEALEEDKFDDMFGEGSGAAEKMESKSVDVTAVMESSSEGDGAEASKNNDGNDDNDNSFIPKEMK